MKMSDEEKQARIMYPIETYEERMAKLDEVFARIKKLPFHERIEQENYTPETWQVRDMYQYAMNELDADPKEKSFAEFDRWFFECEQDSFEHGYEVGWDDAMASAINYLNKVARQVSRGKEFEGKPNDILIANTVSDETVKYLRWAAHLLTQEYQKKDQV